MINENAKNELIEKILSYQPHIEDEVFQFSYTSSQSRALLKAKPDIPFILRINNEKSLFVLDYISLKKMPREIRTISISKDYLIDHQDDHGVNRSYTLEQIINNLCDLSRESKVEVLSNKERAIASTSPYQPVFFANLSQPISKQNNIPLQTQTSESNVSLPKVVTAAEMYATQQLDILKAIRNTLSGRRNFWNPHAHKAYEKINQLHEHLSHECHTYFASDINNTTYEAFVTNCKNYIHEASLQEYKEYDEWSEFLNDLLNRIGTAGLHSLNPAIVNLTNKNSMFTNKSRFNDNELPCFTEVQTHALSGYWR